MSVAQLSTLLGMVVTDHAESGEATTMSIRTTDGRRLGTADEAGALCVTARSPNGVSGSRFREYRNDPDQWRQAGPPPQQVMPGVDMYDLDEVEAWNARRPGSGKPPEVPYPSPLRLELMAAAAAGRLRRTGEKTRYSHALALDGRVLSPAKERQQVSRLEAAGLLGPVDDADPCSVYEVTDAGRAWMTEHAAPAGSTS